MASFKTLPSGAVQVSIKHKLLPKTLWTTFDSLESAKGYSFQPKECPKVLRTSGTYMFSSLQFQSYCPMSDLFFFTCCS
jgi:hypothetical protein